MTRWIRPADETEWTELFESFTKSAYRLEGLQTYNSPYENEAVSRFVAGEPHGVDLSWWTSIAKEHVAAGHTTTRVRVVVEPLTDYTRYELAVYRDIVAAAGDEVRIIVAPQVASELEGSNDRRRRH